MWYNTSVKRRDLMKLIDQIAKERGQVVQLTEGGNHTKVAIGDSITVVPRHREISDLLVKKIVKQLKG
jgi:hypothetical protein